MPRPEIFQRMLSQLAATSTPRFQSSKYASVRSSGGTGVIDHDQDVRKLVC